MYVSRIFLFFAARLTRVHTSTIANTVVNAYNDGTQQPRDTSLHTPSKTQKRRQTLANALRILGTHIQREGRNRNSEREAEPEAGRRPSETRAIDGARDSAYFHARSKQIQL